MDQSKACKSHTLSSEDIKRTDYIETLLESDKVCSCALTAEDVREIKCEEDDPSLAVWDQGMDAIDGSLSTNRISASHVHLGSLLDQFEGRNESQPSVSSAAMNRERQQRHLKARQLFILPSHNDCFARLIGHLCRRIPFARLKRKPRFARNP